MGGLIVSFENPREAGNFQKIIVPLEMVLARPASFQLLYRSIQSKASPVQLYCTLRQSASFSRVLPPAHHVYLYLKRGRRF